MRKLTQSSPQQRLRWIVVAAALVILLDTAVIRADSFSWDLDNEFVKIPNPPNPVPGHIFSGWNNFEIVLSGNQLALLTAQTLADGTTNPFYAFEPATAGVGATYNSSKNSTTFLFTGSAIPTTFDQGWGVDTAHFGLNGPSNGSALVVLSKYWTGEEIDIANPSSSFEVKFRVPGVGVNPPGPLPAPGPGVLYEILFDQYVQNGVVGGEWEEIPIIGGIPVNFTFSSGSASSNDQIFFTNAGYWISSTQLPLDDLNFGDFTPNQTDAFGDGWTQSPLPPPVGTPEPSPLLLMGTGIAGIFTLLLRRRWADGHL